MAGLVLRNVRKVYPNGFEAVKDFNLEIADKEFIIFVGPSGCGKSTTLRMIAGLEDITAGELYIDDKLVNDVEPKDRDIAMVFQNYALYPHMTVYENMAFGLKIRKFSKEEIDQKVKEAAAILHLEDVLDRKPAQMSGGQRQRVAMGRAIVRNPKVFLMDEPLSNLDAKLRVQMRSEISKLHQRLGTTMIYVTHDQVEAMTLGTRIVVMNKGDIMQCDSPMNLYNKPDNLFVASFIGSPQMNFIPAVVKVDGKEVTLDFDGTILHLPEKMAKDVIEGNYDGKKVILGIRPEDLKVEKVSENAIVGQVQIKELLGHEASIHFTSNGVDMTASISAMEPVSVGDIVTPNTVIGTVGGNANYEWWDTCSTGTHLHFQLARTNIPSGPGFYTKFNAKHFNPRDVINFPREGSWFYNRISTY